MSTQMINFFEDMNNTPAHRKDFLGNIRYSSKTSGTPWLNIYKESVEISLIK